MRTGADSATLTATDAVCGAAIAWIGSWIGPPA